MVEDGLTELATQTETHVAAALAVLAAIAATDAICGLSLGRYSRGQDHDSAADLLAPSTWPTRNSRPNSEKLWPAKTSPTLTRLIAKREAQAMVRNGAALVEAAERL